jgi:glucose-6-phosphate isomerase
VLAGAEQASRGRQRAASAGAFAADPGRGERFAAEGAGLYLDHSKNRITAETIRLLLALADECALHDSIAAMFRGERINVSENRSVFSAQRKEFGGHGEKPNG